MPKPKLSKGSRWLLGVAFERFPAGFTAGLHKDPDAPPCNMQNVRGLIRSGLLTEYVPGIFRITETGRALAIKEGNPDA